MKRTIIITESELISLIGRIIKEQTNVDIESKRKTAELELNNKLKGNNYAIEYKDEPMDVDVQSFKLILDQTNGDIKGGKILIHCNINMNEQDIYIDVNLSETPPIGDVYTNEKVIKNYPIPKLTKDIIGILKKYLVI